MKTTISLLLCFLFFTLTPTSASEVFKQLTIDNGLAHTDATCISQDSTGLIWIGTLAGLQSYDGYSLQTFDYYPEGQKIYQSHNRIIDMACNKTNLWIGSESGLTCFNLNTHRYMPFQIEGQDNNRLQTTSVSKLYIDPTGQYLWTRTPYGLTALKTDNNTLRYLTWESETDRIACKWLINLQFQGELIWASTETHIVLLTIRNGQIAVKNKYSAKELLQTKSDICEIHYANNYLYIRTHDGCYRLPITGNQLKKVPPIYTNFHSISTRIPSFTSGEFIVSPKGNLWCAYSEGIFEVQHPFSAQPVIHEYLKNSRSESLSAVKIRSMLIDKYDNLWVTANSWGVYYKTLSRSFFKNLSRPDFQEMGFLQNEIVSVTGAMDGPLYIIVEYASMFRYDPHTNQLSLIPLPKSKSQPLLYQTLQMSRDQRHIYVGTNNGVFIFDTQTQKIVPLIPKNTSATQNVNSSIADIAEDSDGRLWVGLWGNGLVCIDAPLSNPIIKLKLDTQTDPKLLSGQISQILIKGEYIYLCTTNGLNRIRLADDGNIKTFSSYQASDQATSSMSTNYLASIDCQNDSVCWIGTIGGGLNKLVLHSDKNNDYTATCYTTQDGLPSNDCEMVLVDKSSHVWVGGNGIIQLDTEKNKIYTYGFANGLQNNAFKVNVSHKGYDGTFYMGGLYGLSYFRPELLEHNTDFSELMFTGLTINNHRIMPQTEYDGRIVLEEVLNQTNKLTLNYLQNNFTISFAALGYDLSGQIMYRYRLKGFQKEWQNLNYTYNEVYFSNLPYSSYELEVQLSTDKGYTWNEPGRQLEITVLPPWWLSGWAKMTYILLVVLVIVAAFRQYTKEQNLKKENEIQKILIAQDEEKYQAKMQFFMNASHELKTPLTLILLATEKLVGNRQPDKGHHTILYNAKKMLTLITELVDIRKQDLGIASLTMEHLNISEITRQLYDETSPWAENKQISINYTSDKIDIEMDADKNKVGKMIINLITNAIKYTNEGGNIDISLKRGTLADIKPCYSTIHCEGDIPVEQPVCILTVKDTGIGISSESIRLIYERFFQVKGKSDTHLGSGIGLAIVKSTVLQHKGMIIVSSERAVGSEFIIALPIHNQLFNTTSTAHEEFDAESFIKQQYCEFQLDEPVGKTVSETIANNSDLPTLLIVEDNKELQTALKEHFSLSYNVHTADNGRIGLETCMSIFPDIIVSDVMMPEMDGIEMCRCIKNNLSVAYIPLVMLTAKDNIESQIEGYESGADLYIPKPFSMKLLEVNLKRLLAQREQWFKGIPPQPIATPLEPNQDTVIVVDACINKESDLLKPQVTEKSHTQSALILEEQQRITEKLKQIIAENLDDPNLSPDQLANALGISRTKLYRNVKSIDGQSLSDYVRNVRLEKAAHLLLSTNMNVQEVMNEVGFINCSHFTKVFKLKYNMPPTDYKKQY